MLQNSPMYAYLPATDVARARDFYERRLGFRPKEETAGGVVYEFAGGTACFLYPTQNAGTSRASQAFWQVENIDREVAELKSRGIGLANFDMEGERDANGVVTAGGAKVAWINDTEGNILALVQPIEQRHHSLVSRIAGRLRERGLRPRRFGPTAVASTALGALALGAFAIGALAIGRLAVGRASIARLHVGELGVGKVRWLRHGAARR